MILGFFPSETRTFGDVFFFCLELELLVMGFFRLELELLVMGFLIFYFSRTSF